MRGTVAIIGGGIGGLAASIALRDGGWDVTLFERESRPSGAGTALGMWPSALKALDRIGVGVIAATNRDLEEEEIRRGNFRSDLFYRLNVIAPQPPAGSASAARTSSSSSSRSCNSSASRRGPSRRRWPPRRSTR